MVAPCDNPGDDNIASEENCLIFNEFKHFDTVLSHIKSIEKATENCTDEEHLETELKVIFDYYQEQPHLMDPYLEPLITACLSIACSSPGDGALSKSSHFAFRVIYFMMKTRGYKSVIRLMPHTVDDIEPTLALLQSQDIADRSVWETRYVLLLWLSILTMIPFSLKSLDSQGQAPIAERVLIEAKRYICSGGPTQEAASFLIAHLVTRPDVLGIYLEETIIWSIQQLKSGNSVSVIGVLRALANICKIGRRNELLPYANKLLHAVLELLSNESREAHINRLEVKLLQRIGLLFCPPRSASWQYQRGYRSLADNLQPRIAQSGTTSKQDTCYSEINVSVEKAVEEDDDDAEIDSPDEVAEVIDRLIHSLRNEYTVVRWSAAKGLGRMCNRLNKSMVNDVLSAILLLCTRLEPFTAWHGACLALAELGRRCLLLPPKLPEVIPIVTRALFYDERSGDHSYGSNVRDAACYVCWAFARAYRAEDFAPYVNPVANSLVLVSLFDREVNVRRAAGAAFQENVGRQGQFPHGIDIITTCDYFALRNRTNCYLQLSVFVAQFNEYTLQMVDHLADNLISHWDPSIRFLAAQSLNALCPFAKSHMFDTVLPKLIHNSTEGALFTKQGSLFGTAEIIYALTETPLTPDSLMKIKAIVPTLLSRKQFRGLSGELLRKAVCHLIEKASLTKLPFFGQEVVETWRLFLDDCLNHKEPEVQNASSSAYSALLNSYMYEHDGSLRSQYRDLLRQHFFTNLKQNTSESCLAGYLHVSGQAPADLFRGHLDIAIDLVSACSRSTPRTQSWVNARCNALKALVGICKQTGADHPELTDPMLKSIGPTLLQSLNDYSLDSRGDVGSHVRMSGIRCLSDYLIFITMNNRIICIDAQFVQDVFVGIAQQAVEKMDRTRAVAGETFASLLQHIPPIPHIPHHNLLLELFPKSECDEMIWSAPQYTFPKFVQLLDYPIFRFRLILGLVVSVGGLTELTVINSTDAISSYLLAHEADQVFLQEFISVIEQVFEAFSHDRRILLPLFKFLDFLFNNPVMCATVESQLLQPDASIGPALLHIIEKIWSVVRLSKAIERLKAAINVFGALLQFEGSVRQRSLDLLLRLLGHQYPVIRKFTAANLYECLMVYDLTDPDSMDELATLLTETVWESEMEIVRPICDQVCKLLRLTSPGDVGKPSPAFSDLTAAAINGHVGDIR